MDKTIFMVKPQSELLIPTVVGLVLEKGLEVEFWRQGRLPLSVAEAVYQDHRGHRWFPPLVDYIASGQVHIFRVTGPEAFRLIKEVKEQVRAQFRWGRFQSVMHCPNDAVELQWNIEALEGFFVARLEID